MHSTHLSTTVEIAAELRRRADETTPHFSTARIINACFPGVTVTGREIEPGLINMVMCAIGHVIIYRRDLALPEQRMRIAHALGHLIFDGNGRVASCPMTEEAELRAGRFAADLLVPLAELEPCVYRWPDTDARGGKDEIYRDQLDLLSSRFVVPTTLIDKRIRELQRNITNSAI